MDMDVLKKAALRPHQLRSKLYNASALASGTLCRNRDRALTIGTNKLHGEDFLRVQIIPGGRYVVGLADSLICLWDVGPPGSTAHATVLLDTVHLESDHFFTISTPSRASKNAFRFAVYIHEGQEQRQRVHVYEGGPLQGDYRLRLQGELHLDGNASLSRFWISSDRVYLYRDTGLLIVWDFVNMGLSSWDLKVGERKRSCEVIDVANVVILLRPDELYAWKVPALRPIQQHSNSLDGNSEAVNQPFCHIPYPNHPEYAGSSGIVRLMLPSRWAHLSTNTPILVDLVYPPSRMKIRLTRLRIDVAHNEEDVHVTIVSTNESQGLQSLYFTAGVRPYSALGSDLYLTGRVRLRADSERVVIHSSNSGTVNVDEKKWRTVECAVEHGVDTCSLICPYSGRCAYVCQYGHDDGCNRIHVVDLLDA